MKPTDTILTAIQHINVESTNTNYNIGGIWKDYKPKKAGLKFIVKPKHRVSNIAIKTLNNVLRGRSVIGTKPGLFNKAMRKFHAKALKAENVIWAKPGQGQEYFESIYNQTKK